MTEQENSAQSVSEAYTVAAVGHVLATAREEAGLSVEQAASQLRLSRRQVEAIEAGDLDALPGLAFARGFVRNYAKLLQIDAEPLMQAFRTEQSPSIASAHIGLQMENIVIESARNRRPLGVYAIIILLLVALGLAVAWYRSQQSAQTAHALPEALPMAQDVAPLPLPIPQPEASSPSQETPATPATPGQASAPGTVPVPAEAAAAPAQPEPAAPQPAAALGAMTLTFSESSWVSVHDKDGKELYSKTMPAGSSATVEGTPPFRVVLGNARGTQVSYNGEPVDLALHVKGNVARFTLE